MQRGTTVADSIDAYIAAAPARVRPLLRQLRDTIARAAPEATEAIRYRMPTFIWHGNLVHFAAFAGHVGFYPTPSAIVHFAKDLAAYPTSKGTVQFAIDAPLPLKLVSRIVEFRVAETRARITKPSATAKGSRPRTAAVTAAPRKSAVRKPAATKTTKRSSARRGSGRSGGRR